ncbi:MAG: short chain dehydrogenase [Armatimonadetes bacterium JP3_11]|jgi:short-subunit dehydrogenase|nr:MAG: short chain dehydrogenase [Armatimonadetes bacterium JP3_11]RMH07695.1 MAG: SDR family oxidoreductase [Armatimonadota bacterium]
MRFRNKVVWITGASSGIGEALAYAFSREGAHLILTARRRDRLETVRNACTSEGKVLLLPFDVTDYDSHPRMVGAAIEHFGQVDLLINNAGISQRSLVLETDFSVDRRIMEVNYFSVISLTKTVLPYMIERGGGHIAVVSSLLGKFSTPRQSAYCASKHALHGYFDSLRSEVYDQGIRITLICPGFVRTEVSIHALRGDGQEHGQLDNRIARGMPAEVCARHIVNALYKRKEEVYIARYEKIALYLKRFAPGLLSKLMRKIKLS